MVFSLWLAFWASTCFSTPSAAQKGETAALSVKINDLSRAGKYAEAAALAQGQVESLEKKYGPAHRDVGAALNNLAQIYGSQGKDGEAEPLFKRSIAILEKTAGLDSPEIASAIEAARSRTARSTFAWGSCSPAIGDVGSTRPDASPGATRRKPYSTPASG